LCAAREKLAAARARRAAPARDEKQLAAWNALALRGLAIAGQALARPELVQAAAAAAEFLRGRLMRGGRLYASYKDGAARFPANFEGYAVLLDGVRELARAAWQRRWLGTAVAVADDLLARFQDAAGGGFWFTASDHEPLIHRPKPFADESVPSGNGIAA